MDDLATVRVSVLDLDNSVRFSRDIRNAARKHRVTNLPPKWNQTEIVALLGGIKQCCNCISLYDVKDDDRGHLRPIGRLNTSECLAI